MMISHSNTESRNVSGWVLRPLKWGLKHNLNLEKSDKIYIVLERRANMARVIDDFNGKEILIVLGQNIRRARESCNMTFIELSAKSAYDRKELSKLEQGNLDIEFNTAVRLAQVLNVSFPDLFSRNFMVKQSNDNERFRQFREDDYLLVFIENFKRICQIKRKQQLCAYSMTGIQEADVSRIMQRKNSNPRIGTLYAIAFSIETELSAMFSRKMEGTE